MRAEVRAVGAELEAKALFEDLLARKPGQYTEGQLRTLQRRIKRRRVTKEPDKEVFFAQQHRPGEAMQTDFTSGNKLEVTICGEAFPHLLCHPVDRARHQLLARTRTAAPASTTRTASTTTSATRRC